METIAVYWEPVIRVYGFDIKKNVTLLECDFPIEASESWGQQIESLASSCSGFIMVLVQYIDNVTARICIAIDQQYAEPCQQLLEDQNKKDYTVLIQMHQSVDILFFHGPHFQDRYGIAEAAFRTLNQDLVPVHTVGCTGTSVYMIVDSGKAELAKEMLSSAFIVPGYEK